MNRVFGNNIVRVLENAVGAPTTPGPLEQRPASRTVDAAFARVKCDSDLGRLLGALDADAAPDRERHLLWNLSSRDVSEAHEPLNESVVEFLWLAAGVPSQTPPLHEMFRICASIHAWLTLDEENIALLVGNRLRTSMVMACYLRYVRVVETVGDGFNCFCERLGGTTLPGAPRRSPVDGLPPSVRTFFQNFHSLVETERWPSTRPLLLKNILVEGVPVDKLPCLDIHDHNGLCYESHDGDEDAHHWQADEGQGFYRVDRVLTGDFYVSCRFGGDHACDTRNPRNYLFRYSNSARFLAVGEIGLGVDKVDIREYRKNFEDEGFSMALIFEDGEESSLAASVVPMGSPPRVHSTRPIPDDLPVGHLAVKMGLLEISAHHIVKPDPGEFQRLLQMGFDIDACRIALQLTSNRPDQAAPLALTISNLFADLHRPGPNGSVLGSGGRGSGGVKGRRARRATMSALPAGFTRGVLEARNTALDAAMREIAEQTGLDMEALKDAITATAEGRGGGGGSGGEGGMALSPEKAEAYAKFRRMLKMGVPEAAVHKKCTDEGFDPARIHTSAQGGGGGVGGKSEPPVNPAVAKYLKMLKAGVPRPAVEQKMTADGVDPALLDGPPSAADQANANPESMINDPVYGKYVRMLQANVPRADVEEKMVRDGVDATKLPGGATSRPTETKDDGVLRLEDDPRYAKYFRMLKTGVPKDAVAHKMRAEGADSAVLDCNPWDPAPPPPGALAMKDHPRYAKFFKMLKSGVPKDAVAHKMRSVDLNPALLDLDPSAPLPEGEEKDGDMPLKDDPRYAKYLRMVKKGVPKDSVIHKMTADGMDPAALDADPNLPFLPLSEPAPEPALKDDPRFTKYLKMLKSGVPKPAVAHKMVADGLDPAALDADPDKPFVPNAAPSNVPLKDDPRYAKYLDMVKSGMPKPAVARKMKDDGLDPKALDANPEVPFTPGAGTPSAATPTAPKKIRKRRKRLHWKAMETLEIAPGSIWGEQPDGDDINPQLHDFENLFVQSQKPSAPVDAAAAMAKDKKKKKKADLIDGRRATNAGIAIARIKLSYVAMREKITDLEDECFNTVQMRTLQTFLPQLEESTKLRDFTGDEEELNEAEKFMREMLVLDRGQQRLECMIYKANFTERMQQIREDTSTLEKACDDIKLSMRLRKVLRVILHIGNEMNEGTARAFSLETLAKLSSSKAFDNRTTVLDYLVMVVRRNEEDLLDLAEDLKRVQAASRIVMDSLSSDLSTQANGIERVETFAREMGGGDIAMAAAAACLSPVNKRVSMLRARRSELRKDNEGNVHFDRGVKVEVVTTPPDSPTVRDRDRESTPEKTPRRNTPVKTPPELLALSAPCLEVTRFVARARRLLAVAREEYDRMNTKYLGVLSYLGERPDRKSQDFFSILHGFIREFTFSRQRIERQLKSAARTKRIEKAKLEREKMMKAREDAKDSPAEEKEAPPLSVEEHAQAAAMEYAQMARQGRESTRANASSESSPKEKPTMGRRRSVFF